jgi:hypothetical protein
MDQFIGSWSNEKVICLEYERAFYNPCLYLVSYYQSLGDTEKAIEALKLAIIVIEEADPLGRWERLLPDLQKTLTVLEKKHDK